MFAEPQQQHIRLWFAHLSEPIAARRRCRSDIETEISEKQSQFNSHGNHGETIFESLNYSKYVCMYVCILGVVFCSHQWTLLIVSIRLDRCNFSFPSPAER